MGELSRVEDLLETGTEDTVNPLSRVEAILRGEDIKPLSRIEALLEEHSGGGKGGGTYNTDEDKIKNDAFMLHKDTNFIFTEVEKYDEGARTLQYKWDFTKSLTDEIQGKEAELCAWDSSTFPDRLPKRTENGVIFDKSHQAVYFGNGFEAGGHTFEYDVGYAHFEGDKNYHIRHLMLTYGSPSSPFVPAGISPFMWRAAKGWSMYGYEASNGSSTKWGNVWGNLQGDSQEILDCTSGKTVKIVISNNGNMTSIYLDNVLIGTQTGINWRRDSSNGSMCFGGFCSSQSAGDQCHYLELRGLRVYGEK